MKGGLTIDTFNEEEEVEVEDTEIEKSEELSLFTKTGYPKQCTWLKKEVNPYECIVCIEYTGSKIVQICKYFDEHLHIKYKKGG